MNKDIFSKLFKHSAIYGIGQILVRLIAFILLPVVTNPKYLSVEEYGIWNILNITLTILVILMTMGMNTALFKFYYIQKSPEDQSIVSSTTFWFLAFVSIIFIILIALVIQPIILKYFSIQNQNFIYLKWIAIIAVFQVLSVVPFNLLRVEEKSLIYSTIQVVKFIILLIFLILFLMYFKLHIWGLLYGYALAFFITLGILIWNYRWIFRFKLNFSVLKQMLKFGLPLIPLQLGSWVLSVSDRYLIGWQIDYSAVGIYSVGYQLGMLVNLIIIMPFSIAWGPFMFKVYKEDNAREIYARTIIYTSFAGLFFAFFISIFSKEILVLFTSSPEYMQARPIIILVAISYVIYGMYFVFTTGLNVTKKTIYFPFIILVAAVFNIVSNYFLIPVYGILVPAIVTLVSYAILAGLTYYYSQKFYEINFEFRRLFILFFVFIVTIIIGYFWKYDQPIIFCLGKLILLISPILILYKIKFFNPGEISFFKTKFLKFFYG